MEPPAGASDDVPTNVIRVAEAPGPLLAAPAPPGAGGPGRPAESWAGDPPSAASGGSTLAQIGRAAAAPQGTPPSVAPEEWIPVELPERFGRYQILQRLGRGAMGAVYLAKDTQLDRKVALKVPHLRPEAADAPGGGPFERFDHEARCAATLDYPNLCPVYDVGQIDGIPYLTMAYIKGRPLSSYIRRDRPMSQRRAAIMVRKLAQALEEAHFKGVVHRDIKPSNIMVNDRGDLIIVDFGLVWRIGTRNERLTRVGLVVGTPTYMSPEQASGKVEEIGPGCDIYSLGVIMYELLTGRPPFEGPEAVVLGQILFVEPPPPTTYRPDLDPRLEAICLKAIAKRLDSRFATMGEFAMALGDYLRRAEGAPRLADLPAPSGVPEAVEIRDADPDPLPGPAAAAEPAGPELSIEVPAAGTLWKSWRQWTAIVEHYTMRRSPARVNLDHYQQLYKSLLAECRNRAEKAHGPRRDFYLRLAALVVPWMKPSILRATDQEILSSVLSYCRDFESELLDPTELPPEPDDAPKDHHGWRLALAMLVISFLLALAWSYWAS